MRALLRELAAHLDRTVTAEAMFAHSSVDLDLPLLNPNATFTITAHIGSVSPLEPLPYPWDDSD